MTNYKFNKQQHSTKIKEGLERAKKNGKKLGRPSGKIKCEDEVLALYSQRSYDLRYNITAMIFGISESTVKRIIKKHKTNGKS
jgi:DNA invertase Pin-like site-specific DNA recombinase